MPTYTLDARNSGFRASGRFTLNELSVVEAGSTSPVTPNAGGLVYTVLGSESKYTWNTTLPVSVWLTNETIPVTRTVSTIDEDRKSTRLNSSHSQISYAVFCLKKKRKTWSYCTRPYPCVNTCPCWPKEYRAKSQPGTKPRPREPTRPP